AILSDPDVVLRDDRGRLRAEVGPVHPDEALDRIGHVLHGQVELAPVRLSGGLEAVAGGVVEPAMVGAGDSALLDPTVEERRAAVRTVVREQSDVATLVL